MESAIYHTQPVRPVYSLSSITRQRTNSHCRKKQQKNLGFFRPWRCRLLLLSGKMVWRPDWLTRGKQYPKTLRVGSVIMTHALSPDCKDIGARRNWNRNGREAAPKAIVVVGGPTIYLSGRVSLMGVFWHCCRRWRWGNALGFVSASGIWLTDILVLVCVCLMGQ